VLVPTIPQRELRNDITAILRRTEAGESFTVTVNGRPVAELRPLEPRQSLSLAEIVAATPVDMEWSGELAAMRAEEGDAGDITG
jgi:prevent-host-death family protein